MTSKSTFVCLLAATLIACAPAGKTGKQPEHLGAGMREIQKGISWYQKGCYHRALEHFFKSHELFSASDQMPNVAMSLNNIANAYRAIDNIDDALLLYQKAADIYTDLEDRTGLAKTLSNLAAAMIDADRLDRAESVLDQAQAVAEKMDGVLPLILKNRGILLTRKKDFVNAEKVLRSALERTSPANLTALSAVNAALGRLMMDTGRFESAIGYLEAALDADRAVGFYVEIAGDLSDIGMVYEKQGHLKRAAGFYERSLKIYALLENQKKVLGLLGRLEALSEQADIDLKVTRHFVRRWQEGHAHIHPCK